MAVDPGGIISLLLFMVTYKFLSLSICFLEGLYVCGFSCLAQAGLELNPPASVALGLCVLHSRIKGWILHKEYSIPLLSVLKCSKMKGERKQWGP